MAHEYLYGIGNATVGQLKEGDVIQAEVVTATSRVLVDDGDGGLGVGSAVPDDVEQFPGVGDTILGGGGEDIAELLAVDAELQLCPRAQTHGGHPRGEGIVGVRCHGDGLGPYHGAGRGGPVDDHIVAVASRVVGGAPEIGVVVLGVAPHVVGRLAPEVVVEGIAAGEAHGALFKVAIADEVDTRVVAGDKDVHRLVRRTDRLGGGGIGEVGGRRPYIIVGTRTGERHTLSRVKDHVGRGDDGGLWRQAQVERDDAVRTKVRLVPLARLSGGKLKPCSV